MTDDAEGRADGGADAERRANGGADAERAADGSGPVDADADAAHSGDPGGALGDDAPSFGDLSVLQRVFVAAVQNPTRGVVIAGLFAFAFSFYVAFWLAFPRVAAFTSAIGAVLVAIVALVYLVSDRVSG